jgi:hypothetical protein
MTIPTTGTSGANYNFVVLCLALNVMQSGAVIGGHRKGGDTPLAYQIIGNNWFFGSVCCSLRSLSCRRHKRKMTPC